MISYADVQRTLAMLTGNASDKTPDPAEVTFAAWMDHFAAFPQLTGSDLADAVRNYCRTPRERLVQPADISAIALDVARKREKQQAPQEYHDSGPSALDRCREALADAKSGDVAAMRWLLKTYDYYGKLAVLFCEKRGIPWQVDVEMRCDGPSSGASGGATRWDEMFRPVIAPHLSRRTTGTPWTASWPTS